MWQFDYGIGILLKNNNVLCSSYDTMTYTYHLVNAHLLYAKFDLRGILDCSYKNLVNAFFLYNNLVKAILL